MSPPTRVLLAGYFDAGNLGDEAILGATLVSSPPPSARTSPHHRSL